MKHWVLDYLRCPECGQALQLHSFETDGSEVQSGILCCRGSAHDIWYPIVRGVPRLLGESLRRELTKSFVQSFSSSLADCGIKVTEPAPRAAVSRTDDMQELKLNTIRTFGFEWTTYARFGWDDEVYNLEREEGIFFSKSLLPRGLLKERLVLDAGCGNGRYSYWAARHGARVIGVDLGDGVDAAHANTRHFETVQIIQADIFQLPFASETFDLIFSIGVLMHTGDARKATEHLAGLLKRDGSLSIHLYGKGNVIYETVDRALRRYTVRLSVDQLQAFTRRAWRVTKLLDRAQLLPLVGCFVRLDPHPHCIFDWYSAPIATHHTYPDVKKWFDTLGMQVVQTREPTSWKSRLRSRIAPDTVTVRAERSK